MSLAASKTLDNLKAAFAGESQANRRYLYFAQKADVEGYNDVAAVFRSTAEGETGHAHGHLEFMEAVGDPATGLPIGGTSLNPQGRHRRRRTHEWHRTDMYPGMAGARPARKTSTRSPTGSATHGQGRETSHRRPLPARARHPWTESNPSVCHPGSRACGCPGPIRSSLSWKDGSYGARSQFISGRPVGPGACRETGMTRRLFAESGG